MDRHAEWKRRWVIFVGNCGGSRMENQCVRIAGSLPSRQFSRDYLPDDGNLSIATVWGVLDILLQKRLKKSELAIGVGAKNALRIKLAGNRIHFQFSREEGLHGFQDFDVVGIVRMPSAMVASFPYVRIYRMRSAMWD